MRHPSNCPHLATSPLPRIERRDAATRSGSESGAFSQKSSLSVIRGTDVLLLQPVHHRAGPGGRACPVVGETKGEQDLRSPPVGQDGRLRGRRRRELLAWYSTKEDVRIKHEQIVSQFDPPGMLDLKLLADPPQTIPPLVGDIVPSRSFMMVLFPAPLRPRRQTRSPRSMANRARSRIGGPPNAMPTSCIASRAIFESKRAGRCAALMGRFASLAYGNYGVYNAVNSRIP